MQNKINKRFEILDFRNGGFEFPAIGILTTAGVGLLGTSPIQEWRTTT